MNDDWDGADWAEFFSGPDDDETERLQDRANPSQAVDEPDNEDDEGSWISSIPRRPTQVGAQIGNESTSRPSSTRAIANEIRLYNFDSVDDVNSFIKHAIRYGGKIHNVVKNKLGADDYDDDGEIIEFHPYSVELEVLKDVCLDYYRTGKRYLNEERQQIIDSYLSWMHIDQIAYRHKRTPTAIFSILIKSGYAFYQRTYLNPDEQEVDVGKSESNKSGYQTCALIESALVTGRCELLPDKPLELEWEDVKYCGYFFLSELSQSDKEKMIAFVASAISVKSALTLSQRLHQHRLTYLLARQLDDLSLGLVALNDDIANISSQLDVTRRSIESHFRLKAIQSLKIPLLNWFFTENVRYEKNHANKRGFEAGAREFLRLYRMCSASREFEEPSAVSFAVAAVCRDFETIELMAEEGCALATWHCAEKARVLSHFGLGLAVEKVDEVDRSNGMSFNYVFSSILKHLPHDWKSAFHLRERMLTQSELVRKHDAEERDLLDRQIEDSEISHRVGEIEQHFESLGWMV